MQDPSTPTRAAAAPRQRQGFALLELTIALLVLTIGLVSMTQAGSRTHALTRENRERAAAHNALRSTSDRILARSDEIVRSGLGNWSTTLRELYGPGGTVGETFDVPSLNAIDENTPIGTITIVTDEQATDAELGVTAGMPRDLDGDGDTDSPDVGDFATQLPIILEVRYRGFRGERVVRHVLWVTSV